MDEPGALTRFITSRGALAGVLLLGMLLRVWPWLHEHAFRGVLEYDDGVYYGTASLLLHGELPYRDLTIVHPPGVGLLLMPSAFVGELLSDSIGMASARVLVALVAVVNTLLVFRLTILLPLEPSRRRLAGITAAAAYAVSPVAVEAERTAMLEPWVTLCCLLAVLLALRRGTTGLVASGALVALALSTKLFAAAYLVVLLVWLVRQGRRREVITWAAGLLGGLLVLVGPFVAPAPGAFWHDVVVTQVSRPLDAGTNRAGRLVDMSGFGPLPLVLGVLALIALAVALARPVADARESSYWVWLGVGAVTVVAFTGSSSYFSHYGAFLAPPVAILLGRAMAGGGRRALLVLAVLVALGAGSVVQGLRYGGQSDLRAVGRELPAGDCVFAEWASVAVAADRFAPPSADCPMWLDARGAIYAANTDWPRDKDFYFEGFSSDERWQAELRDQLAHADDLLLSRSPAQIPEWSAVTRSYALSHFQLAKDLPGSGRASVQLWSRLPGR